MSFLRPLLLAAVTLALLAAGPTASAQLLITPKRLILDDGRDQGLFSLVNAGEQTRTYRLVWRQLRMQEGGALAEEDDPHAPGNASSLVLVSPMQVTLRAGEQQTVRVRTRLPPNLPDGEYLSHLTFQPLADPVADAAAPAPAKGAQFALQVNLGFSIPVIVRHGPIDTSATIQATRIDPAQGLLGVAIDRTGNGSVYGNVEVYWGQPGEAGVLVGQLNAVAVYANVTRFEAKVPLTPPAGVSIGPGLLQVLLRDPESDASIADSMVRLQ